MAKTGLDKNMEGRLKMNLKEEIKNFIPFDETEEKNKEYLLKWIDTFPDVFTRIYFFELFH